MGSEKPRFSILIAAYNVEKYIYECLESIKRQNFINYEVIIINDGSTDDTENICQNYSNSDERFKLFSRDNHGLVATRREALKHAIGEYVLFLDADDYHIDESMKTIDAILTENNNPDVILFRFRFEYEDGRTKESKRFSEITYHSKDKKELFDDLANNYEYNHLCCKAIKRCVIAKDTTNYTDFYDIRLGEDLLQTIPIFEHSNSVVVSNAVIYGYRVLSGSMSHSFNQRHIYETSKVYQFFYDFIITEHPDFTVVVQSIKNSYAVKMVGLLRTSWEADNSLADKKCDSEIIFEQNMIKGITLPRSLPIQNKILYWLAKNRLWTLCSRYSSILKMI